MLVKCRKCKNEEFVQLHKDGYEVIYGTCSKCMNWVRKFKVPGPPKLKTLRVHLIAHVVKR